MIWSLLEFQMSHHEQLNHENEESINPGKYPFALPRSNATVIQAQS